jgi:outer membrane receptor protein involved in Fe transport
MDLIAIKEAPSGDFYESLGTLKGVDMTAASFGFKVINTRGFNSTSPVRSLQLIDGVDNQSPGLNFSLGNFLGASDLDVVKVDVIAGASTAFYGPGAFNGVINVSAKGGERNMLEGAVRWAQVMKDKAGKPRWAYKLNAFALRADDWRAENYGATSDSPTSVSNPGRYDAVNIYGDEDVTTNNNARRSNGDRNTYPGLGIWMRNGYKEADLVDYSTNNLKLGVSVHYRFTDPDSLHSAVELILASNYSRGSTVYQGDNRYRLKNVQFFQHRMELRKEGKWFVRGYVTHEDAGETYDIYSTALRLQEASGSTQDWNTKYNELWGQQSDPNSWISSQVIDIPGYITAAQAPSQGLNATTWPIWQDQFIQDNLSIFQYFHELVMDSVNRLNTTELDPAYLPGTQRFNDKFKEITGKRFTEGGSKFFDRSALMHAMGEYHFKPTFGEVIVGGNFRQYLPNSAGTIFKDTGDVVIRNNEFGLFTGLEKKLVKDRLKATATVRVDKNQNFKALFSPALSLVWSKTLAHVWRFSFSSAIRNPTLADQYLYYNVGRALLLGNVEGQFEAGRDSMFTIDSFNAYRNDLQLNRLDYFNVDRLKPEQVKTVEIGYRGTHWESVYFDASAYASWYTDFIGYIIGLHSQFDQGNLPSGLEAYRLAANATSQVTTQGANAGLTYYRKKMNWSANYSYNRLSSGADDPIIPAFNTPRNKLNLGFSSHDRLIPFTTRRDLGFGVNWKYVEGFTFEGSPQFTGPINSYDMVDAQVSVKFPKSHLTLKVGASNLFGVLPLVDEDIPSGDRLDRAMDNKVTTVFGGPSVGRLAYAQVVYEFNKQ